MTPDASLRSSCARLVAVAIAVAALFAGSAVLVGTAPALGAGAVNHASRSSTSHAATKSRRKSKKKSTKKSKLPKPKPKPKPKAKPKRVLPIPKDPATGATRTPAPPAGSTSTPTSSSPTQVVGELSDAQAAKLVTSTGEVRPDNATDNQTVPSPAELSAFRSADDSMPATYLARIDGAYRGTTDEIIQWAAYKWGLDPQLMRAVAAVESWWHMSTVGDGGNAFGLYQLDARYHCCQALAQSSTAFDADYYGAIVRSYYDGDQIWLNTVSGNGRPYAAGDLWDSVGYWASGRWDTPAGASYDAQVQADLGQQVWLGQWF